MVKLGSPSAVSALDELLQQKTGEAEGEDAEEEEEEPKAKVVPPKEDTSGKKFEDSGPPALGELWEELVEQMGEKDYLREAGRARRERELVEKYGVFKDFILHPTTQEVLTRIDGLRDITWVDPGRVLPMPTALIIMGMAWRGGMRTRDLYLLFALFLGVHPFLVVLAGTYLFFHRQLPKGCTKPSPWPPKPKPTKKSSAASGSAGLSAAVEGDGNGKDLDPARRPYTADALEDSEEVDYIILGGDVGSLYCAALLSRCGKRVLVLEEGKVLGDYVVEAGGRGTSGSEEQGSLEFDVSDFSLQRARETRRMLSTVMTQEPTWNLVGSPDSEFVHTVTVVGDSAPYLWRTGFEAWSEDMISAGADRDLLRVIMDQLLKARAGAHQWIVAKLSKEASTTAADDKGYAGLLTKGAAEVLNRFIDTGGDSPEAQQIAAALYSPETFQLLVSQYRKEAVNPKYLSYGVLAHTLTNSLEGFYYPEGGPLAVVRALLPAIESGGGMALCQAKWVSLVTDDDGEAAGDGGETAREGTGPQRACGIKLADNKEIRAREGVISGLGVVETMKRLMPKEVLQSDTTKQNFPRLSQPWPARPVIVTLVGLDGSTEELDLFGADYFELPSPLDGHNQPQQPPSPGASGSWLQISFPSAKDPTFQERFPNRSTCVMLTEAEDKWVEEWNTKHEETEYLKKRKQKLEERLKRKLLETFPQVEGHIAFMRTMIPPRSRGISAHIAAFQTMTKTKDGQDQAVGTSLTPVTPLPGLSLTGSDLVQNSTQGAIVGGWLTAHHVLGYTPQDVLVFKRNIASELPKRV